MALTEDIIINIEVEGASNAESSIDGVTESLEQQSDAADKAGDEVDEYSNSMVDSAKNTKIFGVSINDLSKGMRAATATIRTTNGALKLFKIALIATGIGAIVVALGSLVAVFTKTQGGIESVTRVMDLLGTIINVVIDRFITFGKGLIQFFKGNFREGIELMGSSFKDLGAEIREAGAASLELSDAFAQLERDKVANIVVDAKLRAESQKLLEISKDTEKSIAVRLKASREFEEVENRRAAEGIRIAREELRILQERNKLSTSTLADQREEAELEAQVFRLQEENSRRQVKNRTELNRLRQLAVADTVEAIQVESAEAIRAEKETADEILKINQNLAAGLGRIKKVEQNDDLERFEAKIALAELEARQTLDIFGGLAGGLANLAGQESKFGKAAAIAQAVINTQLGITAALTALTMAGRIAGVAFALTTGLAAIRNIRSEPLPKVTIQETPFGSGGPILGPSHKSRSGGVWINAEGGEYVVNKSAMRDPINRAIIESINDGKQSTGRTFQDGGFVNTATIQLMNLEHALANMQPVLILPDLDRAQNIVEVTENISTLQ